MVASPFRELPWARVGSRCHRSRLSNWNEAARCGWLCDGQITPGLDVDYAISLRLHDAAGEKVFQEDAVLWDREHLPTSYWSGDVPVDTLALLAIPANLPAGNYELRLVVYNFETLVPTVELGVWEPEKTLARLRLTEGQ